MILFIGHNFLCCCITGLLTLVNQDDDITALQVWSLSILSFFSYMPPLKSKHFLFKRNLSYEFIY